MKYLKVQNWQQRYMRMHSQEYTARELAEKLGLTRVDINNYCYRHNLELKPERKKAKVGRDYRSKHIVYFPPVTPKKISRPPALYSNKTPYGIAGSSY